LPVTLEIISQTRKTGLGVRFGTHGIVGLESICSGANHMSPRKMANHTAAV
jgi:hypothetical protein